MAVTNNPQWEACVVKAREEQQNYYELFTEWTIFGRKDHNCLKSVIGIAIFGSPNNENYETDINEDSDFSQMYAYDKKQKEIIDQIFQKVYEYGKGYKSKDDICFGVVYNILFPTKDEFKAKPKKEPEAENTNQVGISLTPIFKIRKHKNKYVGNKIRIMHEQDQTWYIDIHGRVYKSWTQYKENNTLPRCTMVLPKHGIYQPDPSHPITETSSVVWLDVQDSPSCSTFKRICNYIDYGCTATNAISIAVVGVSLFTPIGPVVGAAGLVASGVSGSWTLFRSIDHLVDRSKHEQTIAPTNRETIGPWLGVVGTAAGFAATGSTVLLSKVAQTGKEAGKVAKFACNAAIGSNLAVNGVGIVYQGVCLIQRYQEEDTVRMLDVIMFTTHVFFFGHAVMNARFANDIIKSTQGKILDEYRSSIRSKNLRKAFNRAQRVASQNSSDAVSQNAEVIRYINNKKITNMQSATNVQSSIANLNKAGVDVQLENGNLKVDDITILDPMKVAGTLVLSAATTVAQASNNNSGNILEFLQKLASEFVESIFGHTTSALSQHVPNMTEFYRTLNDLTYQENPEQILRLLFTIVSILIQRSDSLKSHIVDAVHFVWQYAKCHLRQFANSSSNSSSNLRQILGSILSVIEVLTDELLRGFQTYQNGLHLFE